MTELLARKPGDRGALMTRANVLERLGRPQDALEDYRIAAALDPDDALARHNLGVLLTDGGRLDEAFPHLERGREIGAPGHASLSHNRVLRGRAAFASGESVQAAELFAAAEREARAGLALDGSNPELHQDLAAALVEQHRVQAGSAEKIAEAISHYTKTLELWRGSRDPQRVRGEGITLVNLCDVLIESRQLDRARAACSDVTSRFPDEATGFYNLAGVHALGGRRDSALAALERDYELGDRDAAYLAADPWFEGLREDPRFQLILERMRRPKP